MRIYKEEIFGPCSRCSARTSYDEALRSSPTTTSTATAPLIFTRDGDAARDFASKVQVGMVGINVPIRFRWPTTPSAAGSARSSATSTSTGRIRSASTTKTKTVTARWPRRHQGRRQLRHPDDELN